MPAVANLGHTEEGALNVRHLEPQRGATLVAEEPNRDQLLPLFGIFAPLALMYSTPVLLPWDGRVTMSGKWRSLVTDPAAPESIVTMIRFLGVVMFMIG